jgi:flagellar biosynthesis protein FlhF
MRVKTFTADSTAAAMDLVRDALGDDAVIVSSHQDADGPARIVAAIEPLEAANEDTALTPADDPLEAAADPSETAAYIGQALLSHGVPIRLARRLAQIGTAEPSLGAVAALTRAFDMQLGFSPLEPFSEGMAPLALVGPPGAGKTITAAKICARAHMAKQSAIPVTTDVKRAGGIEQFAAFTRILKLELETAPDAEALRAIVRKHRDGPGRLVIDTAGTNPYDDADMAALARILDAADAEPVLVLAAGGDATETADMAAIYARAGATRMIATRMDIARRLGGIIAAADAARLPLSDVSTTHRVGEGLDAITPGTLARMVMNRGAGVAANSKTTYSDEDRK